jgi:hypothetical protein
LDASKHGGKHDRYHARAIVGVDICIIFERECEGIGISLERRPTRRRLTPIIASIHHCALSQQSAHGFQLAIAAREHQQRLAPCVGQIKRQYGSTSLAQLFTRREDLKKIHIWSTHNPYGLQPLRNRDANSNLVNTRLLYCIREKGFTVKNCSALRILLPDHIQFDGERLTLCRSVVFAD